MTHAAVIVARLRARGANVEIVDKGLRIVNRHKLPLGSVEYIGRYAEAIAAFLGDEADEIDERAAIIEYEGKTPREWAEQAARILVQTPSPLIDRFALAWFKRQVGEMLAAAPLAERDGGAS